MASRNDAFGAGRGNAGSTGEEAVAPVNDAAPSAAPEKTSEERTTQFLGSLNLGARSRLSTELAAGRARAASAVGAERGPGVSPESSESREDDARALSVPDTIGTANRNRRLLGVIRGGGRTSFSAQDTLNLVDRTDRGPERRAELAAAGPVPEQPKAKLPDAPFPMLATLTPDGYAHPTHTTFKERQLVVKDKTTGRDVVKTIREDEKPVLLPENRAAWPKNVFKAGEIHDDPKMQADQLAAEEHGAKKAGADYASGADRELVYSRMAQAGTPAHQIAALRQSDAAEAEESARNSYAAARAANQGRIDNPIPPQETVNPKLSIEEAAAKNIQERAAWASHAEREAANKAAAEQEQAHIAREHAKNLARIKGIQAPEEEPAAPKEARDLGVHSNYDIPDEAPEIDPSKPYYYRGNVAYDSTTHLKVSLHDLEKAQGITSPKVTEAAADSDGRSYGDLKFHPITGKPMLPHDRFDPVTSAPIKLTPAQEEENKAAMPKLEEALPEWINRAAKASAGVNTWADRAKDKVEVEPSITQKIREAEGQNREVEPTRQLISERIHPVIKQLTTHLARIQAAAPDLATTNPDLYGGVKKQADRLAAVRDGLDSVGRYISTEGQKEVVEHDADVATGRNPRILSGAEGAERGRKKLIGLISDLADIHSELNKPVISNLGATPIGGLDPHRLEGAAALAKANHANTKFKRTKTSGITERVITFDPKKVDLSRFGFKPEDNSVTFDLSNKDHLRTLRNWDRRLQAGEFPGVPKDTIRNIIKAGASPRIREREKALPGGDADVQWKEGEGPRAGSTEVPADVTDKGLYGGSEKAPTAPENFERLAGEQARAAAAEHPRAEETQAAAAEQRAAEATPVREEAPRGPRSAEDAQARQRQREIDRGIRQAQAERGAPGETVLTPATPSSPTRRSTQGPRADRRPSRGQTIDELAASMYDANADTTTNASEDEVMGSVTRGKRKPKGAK